MKRRMPNRKKDKAFVIACLIVLFLCVLYLLADFTRKSLAKAEGRDVIGKAVYVQSDVRRKNHPGESWDPLRQGGDLFDDDMIESGSDGTASVLLDDGSLIDLCADSLMTLERSGDETRVSLVKGCGSVNRTGAGTDRKRKLVVVEDDHRITLDNGRLSMEKEPGGRPEIFIHSGTAELDIRGKALTLRANERAVLDRESASVEEKKLTLISPAEGARLYAAGDTTPLNLSWRYSGTVSGREPYLLEIATNRRFSGIFKRIGLAGTEAAVAVPRGAYYWRVSATDPVSKMSERSETGRFTVLRDGPLVLLAPVDGEILDYAIERPRIVFAWEPHPVASSYRLEISERPDFSGTVKRIDTRVVNLACQLDREVMRGRARTYYWRVSAGRDLPDWTGRTSDVRRFSIQRTGAITPPQLVSPKDRKKLFRPRVDSDRLIFSWERTEANLKKTICFSADREFSAIYRSFEVGQNYWTMNKSFPAGTYYWRVGLCDQTSGKTVYSGSRSFVMQDYEEISLISPEDEATFVSGESGYGDVTFKWKKPDSVGKYIVELSDARESARVIGSIRSVKTSASGKQLSSGRYFWRVKMVDAANAILAASDARSFTVEEGLPAPVIISPRSGRRVDMSHDDQLKFLWEPSRGASAYLLELHQIVGNRTKGADRLVASTQTTEPRYSVTDMGLLDVGSFYWTLKAVRKGPGGNVTRTSRKLKSNFKISVMGGSKVIVISPKIQVIEDEKRK